MRDELEASIRRELEGAEARVSLLMTDLDSGAVLHTYRADEAVSSASTIKVPILLAALEAVRQGRLTLDTPVGVPAADILDDTEEFEYGACVCALSELLYWMIVSSDNTATNVLIKLLGFDAVNAYAAPLGLRRTVLARKMLDFKARDEGRDNITSAADMAVLFSALYHRRILTLPLCQTALDILLRQRSTDLFLRYITDPVTVAHKTGGLDSTGHNAVAHDAGIFYLGNIRYYLGIFVTEAPDETRYAHRLIGRLSKALYDAYK